MKSSLPWLLAWRVCLLAVVSLWAGAARGGMGGYFADVWTSENGLPDSSVSAIAQTPDGYLWVGTYNGLARFDGEHFVTFDPANTPALCHARVRKLYVDSGGTLWVVTYDGSLTVFRAGSFQLEHRVTRASDADLTLLSANSSRVSFSTSRGGLLSKSVAAPAGAGWEELSLPNRGQGALFCEDKEGTIWSRDRDGKMWRLAGGKFEPLPDSAGLAGLVVSVLTTDELGRVWVGTDKGIASWDGARFQNVTPSNGESDASVTFLFVATKQRLWAMINGELRGVTGRQWISAPQVFEGLSGDLGRLTAREVRDGSIWFYNYNSGRGLLRLGVDGQVRELANREFPQSQVNCFFEDREGNVWIGLSAGGLVRVREKQFQAVEGADALPEPAKSVSEDTQGAIWIGTLGGLQRWRQGLVTNVFSPDRKEPVFCVCPDGKGRLWLSAGDSENLYLLEDGELKAKGVQGVKALLSGHDGRMWAGTRSGLYCAEQNGEFRLHKGIPRHYVRALAEDPAGILWAGAGNGELYRVAGEEATRFQPTDNKNPAAIWSLLADKDGTVWIGTFRGGLLRFRNGQFTRFDKQDGFPDNVICQILNDDQGNLWLGSHQGVFRVSKSALESESRGESRTLPCATYGRPDGLPSLECSGDYQPSAWRTRDGRLWFATIKGAVFTEPSAVHKNLMPPSVVIEDFFVDGKDFEDGKWRAQSSAEYSDKDIVLPSTRLQLPPGTRRFEFHYAGLSLTAPEQVRFRYRLEGFEKDWVEAGTQRSAQYSFLPPGDYRFHVIACNSDGVWNEAGKLLALTVLPHVYETWWFRLMAGLILVGGIGGIVRSVVMRKLRLKLERLERQRAVERERARIARDIHDDLGASLNLIAVLGDLARHDKASERIERMSSTARQAVKSLDEIVWAVNPRNDTLAHLIDYTCQFATDYLRAAGVRCLLDVPEQLSVREVSANVRHNVFLAVKEALQNIVKHSQATQVWLRIMEAPQGLRIAVEDNGRGFDGAPPDPEADGLSNMSQRLKEVGGECRVRSVAGQGTEIGIELPWPP